MAVNVAPFNNLPTGYAVVGDPDPETGAVSGSVVGTDPDGDPLTFTGSTNTARVVSVAAGGNFPPTCRPRRRGWVLAPNATAADKLDVFTVSIDDGRGGAVMVPVTVRLAVSAELSTFCRCIADAGRHDFPCRRAQSPDLGAIVDLDRSTRGERSATPAGDVGRRTVDGQYRRHAGEHRERNPTHRDRDLSTAVTRPPGPASTTALRHSGTVRWWRGMPDVPAWDRHLLVFQEGTCISQELYNVANGVEPPAAGIGDAAANAIYAAIWGSSWIAEAGVHYDMNSRCPVRAGANAPKLPHAADPGAR